MPGTWSPTSPWTVREDLISAGLVGLVEAARRFHPGKGSFKAYAARRIRGAIKDQQRVDDILPRSQRRLVREGLAESPTVSSIDRLSEVGFLPSKPLRDPTARPTTNPLWPVLAGKLRELPPIERRCLLLLYGRGLTLKEAGAEVGLSESGVCRVRMRALAKLRTSISV